MSFFRKDYNGCEAKLCNSLTLTKIAAEIKVSYGAQDLGEEVRKIGNQQIKKINELSKTTTIV